MTNPKPEPVAWMYTYDGTKLLTSTHRRSHWDGHPLGTETPLYPASALEEAYRRGQDDMRERAIAEFSASVEDRVGIPCPDGIPGCAVFHFRKVTRARSFFEVKEAIRALEIKP